MTYEPAPRVLASRVNWQCVTPQPRIETHLVRRTRSADNVGEPGAPPIARAVPNAPFVLMGKRLQSCR